MNKTQKEVELAKLKDEEKELKQLKAIYNKAADDITNKIKLHNGKINVLLSDFDNLDDTERSILQSQIYQRDFQKSLKSQIDGFLSELNSKQYASVDEYLQDSYETGYIGSMYDIHKQGIPVVTPIDQKNVVKAMTTDSKISKKLYTKLGEDVEFLKKRIANNLSRGIATGSEWKVIARNIAADSNVGFNRAMRIARTEGHRIQVTAADDAQHAAKKAGADVVKQWDAALDGRTRPTHRKLDGQIRELDEPFEVNGMKVMRPSGFGRPEEDINCRCALLQRARWALDEDELQTLKDRAAYYGLDKTKDFEDFKQKYLKAADTAVRQAAKTTSFVPARTIEEAEEYAKQFVRAKTWSGDGNVSYKGLSLESANKLNETLLNVYEQNDIPLLRNIEPMNFRQNIWKGSEKAPMAYRSISDGDLFFNPKIMKNAKTLDAYMEEGEKAYKFCAENIDKFKGADRELIETYLKAGRSLVAESTDDAMKTIIEHEIGHHIQHSIIYNSEEMAKVVADGFEEYAVKISGYATKSKGEYIAESYAAFCNGKTELIDPKLAETFGSITKEKVVEAMSEFEEITLNSTVKNVNKDELKTILKNAIGLENFEEKYNDFSNSTIKELVASTEKIKPKQFAAIKKANTEIKQYKLNISTQSVAYNSSVRKQLGTMDETACVSQLMEDLGITKGKAKEYISEIQTFTRNGYKEIRDTTITNVDTVFARKAIEDYITAAPKYDGNIYRGIKFDADSGKTFIEKLAEGAELDMNGISSWTSSKEYAQKVASNHNLDYQVVFSCKNKTGVGIEHISTMPEEKEVLQSANSRFKITSVQKQGTHYLVEMEEV